jgi:hypothetical protein
MWMSFTMDGNKKKMKWLIVKHKALKWSKLNIAPPLPLRITLMGSHGKWVDWNITFTITMIVK